jgi:hypothetical protein
MVYATKHIAQYQWFLYGMVAFFILYRIKFLSRNIEFLQTATHEVTHAIVGMLFFHKIHSMSVNEDSGEVYHSGRRGAILISLAPYCLPIFTFAFMVLSLLGATDKLFIFHLLIGFTLGFHLLCCWKQTRLYQTDIKRQGYVRAILFIAVAWFFNATLILLTISRGVVGAITYLFPQYWHDLVDWWNIIF